MKKRPDINFLLIGAVIVLAATALLRRNFFSSGGAVATVNFDDGRPSFEISLDEDGIYNIETDRFPVTLQVSDGRIRFIDSRCPDHLCEGFGYISHEGESAICMPAGVAVLVG